MTGMHKNLSFRWRKTVFALVAGLFLLLAILPPVAAEPSETTSSEIVSSESSQTSSSRGSIISKSPLVEDAESKAAESSRLAADDPTTGIARWAKDKWAGFSRKFNSNFITNNGWKLIVRGLLKTLQLTTLSTLVGVVLGLFVGVIRSVHDTMRVPGFGLRLSNRVSKIYVTVIRGTPVLVQLLIINFVIFGSLPVSKLVVAVIAFGLNSGAYVSEIIRSGIMTVDAGQTEAGRSLGLSYTRTMYKIVLPQAFKNVLPALGNEFIVLLKETSVASVIAIEDLTRAGQIIQGKTYEPFMPYIAVALIYLIVVMGFSKLVDMLERRLRVSDRR